MHSSKVPKVILSTLDKEPIKPPGLLIPSSTLTEKIHVYNSIIYSIFIGSIWYGFKEVSCGGFRAHPAGSAAPQVPPELRFAAACAARLPPLSGVAALGYGPKTRPLAQALGDECLILGRPAAHVPSREPAQGLSNITRDCEGLDSSAGLREGLRESVGALHAQWLKLGRHGIRLFEGMLDKIKGLQSPFIIGDVFFRFVTII